MNSGTGTPFFRTQNVQKINIMSTNQSAIIPATGEARTAHETGYQVIDGVAITPELLERVQILQTNCNEGITLWQASAMRLIDSFMTCSEGNLADGERVEHVWTICNLIGFVSTMGAPHDFLFKQMEEGRHK